MIILKKYLLNKNTNLSAKCEDGAWIKFIINFPRIVTGSHAKQKLGYLWHLAETLVADYIRDVLHANLNRSTNFFVIKPTRCTNFTIFFGMNLYIFRTVRLSVIRSLFTVHSAMIYVTHVCRQLSNRTCWSCSKAVYKPV